MAGLVVAVDQAVLRANFYASSILCRAAFGERKKSPDERGFFDRSDESGALALPFQELANRAIGAACLFFLDLGNGNELVHDVPHF